MHVIHMFLFFLFFSVKGLIILFLSTQTASASPQVSAGPDGSANYSMPIKIPPGVNGLQPNLAITYNSNVPNGILGVGFQLQGLPAITRMNNGRGINYDEHDTFTGPGGKLIRVDTAHSIYHSENEDWIEYVPYGRNGLKWSNSSSGVTNDCGNGPCYWIAYTTDGKKLHFGAYDHNESGRKVKKLNTESVRVWPIRRITDSHGNSIFFDYVIDTQNGDYYPRYIFYNVDVGTPWGGGVHIIKFNTEDRGNSDKTIGYSQSTKVIYDRRISSIEVRTDTNCNSAWCNNGQNSILIRKYEIDYDISISSKRSRIISIREKGKDSTETLSRVIFTWKKDLFSHNPGSSSIDPFSRIEPESTDYIFHNRLRHSPLTGRNDSTGADIIPGDFDGDGKMDFIRQGRGAWGDDYDDVHDVWNLVVNTFSIYFSNGDGTFRLYIPTKGGRALYSRNLSGNYVNIIPGDYNGDGMMDFIAQKKTGNSNYRSIPTFSVYLSKGNGYFDIETPTGNAYQADLLFDGGALIIPGDYNGDGKTDFIRQEKGDWDHDTSNTFSVYFSNGHGTFRIVRPGRNVAGDPYQDHLRYDPGVNIIPGDYNGDGRTDFIRQEKGIWDDDIGITFQIYFSNGDGTFRIVTPGSNVAGDPYQDHLRYDPGANIILGDYNGDGKMDFIRQEKGDWDHDASNTFSVYFSRGDGTFRIVTPGTSSPETVTFDPYQDLLRYDPGVNIIPGDYNGDGRTDFIRQEKGIWDDDIGITFQIYFSNGDGFFNIVTPGRNSAGDPYQDHLRYDPGALIITGDYDGDGRMDFIRQEKGDWDNDAENTFGVYLSRMDVDLIESIDNQMGARTTIFYKPVNQFTNAVRPIGGSNGIPNASPRYLVEKVNVAVSDQVYTTKYDYTDGRYYPGKVKDRADLGFSSIKIEQPNGFIIKNAYDQRKKFRGHITKTTVGTMVGDEYKYVSTTDYSLEVYKCNRDGCSLPNYANLKSPRQVRIKKITHKQYNGRGGITTTETTENTYNNDGFLTISRKTTERNRKSRIVTRKTSYYTALDRSTVGLKRLGMPHNMITCVGNVNGFSCENEEKTLNRTRMIYDDKLSPIRTIKRLANNRWFTITRTFNLYGTLATETDGMTGITKTYRYEYPYKSIPTRIETTSPSSSGENVSGNTTTTQSFSDFDYKYFIAKTTINANGLKKKLVLDQFGRVKETTSEKPDGSLVEKTTISYYTSNRVNNFIQTCVHYGSSFSSMSCSREYRDGLGRITRRVIPAVQGTTSKYVVNETEYDSKGYKYKIYLPYYANTMGEKTGRRGYTKRMYDAFGKLFRIVDPDNRQTTYFYDESVASGNGEAVNSSSVVDARGIRKRTYTDVAGRVVKIVQAVGTPEETSISYSYKEDGRLTQVVSPQGTTRITYNLLKQQAYIIDPNAGKTSYTYYDVMGKPSFGKIKTETKSDPNSTNGSNKIVTKNEYNASFGRLSRQLYQSKVDSGGAGGAGGAEGSEAGGESNDEEEETFLIKNTFRYDEASTGQYNKGHLTSTASESNGFTISKKFNYGIRGKMVQEKRSISKEGRSLCSNAEALPCKSIISRGYDTLNRMTHLIYPDGSRIDYEYLPGLGKLHKIKEGNTVYATYSGYNVFGQPGNVKYGNKVNTVYTYDPKRSLIQTMTVTPRKVDPALVGNQNLMDHRYSFDSLGNVIGSHDSMIRPLTYYSYRYDHLNRLVSHQKEHGLRNVVLYNYSYDKQGNLLIKDELTRKKLCYDLNCTRTNIGNKINHERHWNATTNSYETNDDTYSYNWSASGNMISKTNVTDGTIRYKYDARNMIYKIYQPDGGNTYRYDESGQRFLKVFLPVNGTRIRTHYLSDGFELREKWNIGFGQVISAKSTKFILGPSGQKIASITSSDLQASANSERYYAFAAFYNPYSISGLIQKSVYLMKGSIAWIQESIFSFISKGHRSIYMVLLIVSFLSLFCFYFRYVWGILFLRVSAETDLNAYRVILRLGHYALVSSLEKKGILTPFVLQNRFTAHFSPMIIFLLFSVYSCGSNPVPEEYSDIDDNILHALPPSGIYYYSHDHLGSSSLITDSNGEEVIRTHYTPYGEVDLHYTGKYNIPTLEERSSDPNPISNDRSDDFTRNGAEDPKHASLGLKFTGQDYDPESNLYYYNARYYDPTIGLFTTADTIVPNSTDSQAYNRYMYVMGNPITYTDPSGNIPKTVPPWHCFTGPDRKCDLDQPGVTVLDEISRKHDKAGANCYFSRCGGLRDQLKTIVADLAWIGEGLWNLVTGGFIWGNFIKAFEDVDEWHDVFGATGKFIVNSVVDITTFALGTAFFTANILYHLSTIALGPAGGTILGAGLGFLVGGPIGAILGGIIGGGHIEKPSTKNWNRPWKWRLSEGRGLFKNWNRPSKWRITKKDWKRTGKKLCKIFTFNLAKC